MVLLRPFSGLFPNGEFDIDVWSDSGAGEEIIKSGQEMVKQIIEERTGAYILNKSEQVGLPIQVNVVCTDEVLTPTPWAVTIRSKTPEHARNALSRMIHDELGIPPERQRFELSGEAG
jgi:stage III sporulation protein AF